MSKKYYTLGTIKRIIDKELAGTAGNFIISDICESVYRELQNTPPDFIERSASDVLVSKIKQKVYEYGYYFDYNVIDTIDFLKIEIDSYGLIGALEISGRDGSFDWTVHAKDAGQAIDFSELNRLQKCISECKEIVNDYMMEQ